MTTEPQATQKSLIVSYLLAKLATIPGMAFTTRKLFKVQELRSDQFPAASVTNGPETRKRISINANMIEATWTLDLVAYVMNLEDPQGALDELVAKITMAIAEDHTLGRNAIRSEILDNVNDRGIFDPFGSAVIKLQIVRRFNELTQGG